MIEPRNYLVPTVVATTSPTAYVRFHGRNLGTWNKRGGSAAERFDYLYSDDELGEWVEPLRELAEKSEQAYAFFNNNASSEDPDNPLRRVSQAATNAHQLRRLLDGMTVDIGGRAWRCIAGYGHAPEHIALYCENLTVMIGGDMMLPRISTNVSVYEQEPEADALALFLNSIDKFKVLPEDTLVLPSHGKPFVGMHTRITQLHEHHRDRLAEVMQACAESPCSAADILPVLFKRAMDTHQTTFAMGEAIAHLHALWFEAKLVRTRDADGVFRFSSRA